MGKHTIVVMVLATAGVLALLPARTPAQFSGWQHSGSLWILTTRDGANLPAEVEVKEFPLLVRLQKDFFNFSQAQPNGADLRFSSSNGEPLAYHGVNGDIAYSNRIG